MDHPTYTIDQAAELLGVQVAFLRSLDTAGVVEPCRSAGGHRRWSSTRLRLAVRVRTLPNDGHPPASAEILIGLWDDVTALRAALNRTRPDRASPDL